MAGQIEEGDIEGTDVSGLLAVSVSRHGGHRQRPKRMQIVLFVDKRADSEQRAVLEAAFTGRLGGPLAELAELGPKGPPSKR